MCPERCRRRVGRRTERTQHVIPMDDGTSLGRPRLLVRRDLIAVILRLQFDGWLRALQDDPALSPGRGEVYLNGRLFDGMEKVRIALRLSNLWLEREPGIGLDPHSARHLGEPDVSVIIAGFISTPPHAIIECKKLSPHEEPRKLRREYVVSGMDRFINGPYLTNGDVNFMIAYVDSGSEEEAMHDVNEYLSAVNRLACSLDTSTEYNSDFGLTGYIAKSIHVCAPSSESFLLLHTFVTFPSAQPDK